MNNIVNSNNETKKVNNILVWIVAFIPIVGTLFSFGSFVFLAVNIVLTYFDENALKKAGYDTSVLGNAWLIPVYLYKRANMLNHNKLYFIIWCITFLISFI